MSELIHEKLSEDTIGAAMKVLNALGPGLDEKLYENALVIELTKRGHHLASSMGAFVAVDQNHAGRCHVQRQAQHGGKQQHGGE